MMDLVITVYMDNSDVTKWVRSVEVTQMDSINRKFVLKFNAWSSFGSTNRWDIFGSVNSSNPRAEVLIRNGIIPSDRPRSVSVSGGTNPQVPTITATGYEYVWLAKRRGPRDTIIMVPSFSNVSDDVRRAIEESREEVGTYRVWTGCNTLHEAVKKLGRAAGLNVSVRIPDYPMVPYVVPKKHSFWREITNLTDPYVPHKYYVRSTNTLVVADKQDAIMGAGNKLILTGDVIDRFSASPTNTKRVRRVIASRPPWR
jgi:hypothetical protein